MKKILKLNPGSQYNFVTNEHRHSAYLGGVGSGKTFALCVRGLQFAQQPKIPGELPPIGVILTISVPVLKDIIIPAMSKVLELTGVKADYKVTDRKYVLRETGAEIWLRGLDEPNRIRGIECSWFGIDEGRNFQDDYAYTIMMGRLRQGIAGDVDEDTWVPGKNYKHAGWVCSTPNGYDWMWKLFHPDSPYRMKDVEWYNAPVYDNEKNLGRGYIEDLERKWNGRFFEQEALGRFVGVIAGAVFPEFDPKRHVAVAEYDEALPLFSFWDFGIGDAGVCIFAQLTYTPKLIPSTGEIEQIPHLRVIDAIEMRDSTVQQWARAYHKWLSDNTDGRTPHASWGDPAGDQRNPVTGTSVLKALQNYGVYVRPAPKKPVDEGIHIVQNLLEGEQITFNVKCERLIQAVQTYRWKVDDDGVRLNDRPVHDWTSHFCDALRYGVLGAVGLYARRKAPAAATSMRGTIGYILEGIMNPQNENIEMGMAEVSVNKDWHRDEQIGLGDLLG